MPPDMIRTTIVPIVNNKCGNLSESINYRPIALATIISKVFESVLLLKCEEYLFTSSNQFGYKKGHSTDLCMNALKEFIEHYKKRSTSVFVTMFDASKAFDRVKFWLLFDKLITRSVLLLIVRILSVWYTHYKCASGGVMPISHPLVILMVLSKVEFCHQFFSMFIWMI